MVEQFENNYTTLLNGAIDDNDTTIVVDTGPDMTGQFRIKIDDELILVGSVSGTTFSDCSRGVEGTVAASHSDNAVVEHVLTAGSLEQTIEDALVSAGKAFIGAKVNATSTALNNGSYTTVAFAAADSYDTDNIHDPSSDNTELKVPVGMGGKWFLNVNAGFIQTSGALTDKRIAYRINGGTDVIIWRDYVTVGAGGITHYYNGSVGLDLAAEDYVEVRLYGDAASVTYSCIAEFYKLTGSDSDVYLPWHIDLRAETPYDTNVGEYQIVAHAQPGSAPFFANGGVGITNGLDSPAQNDEIGWYVVLAAGTWNFTLNLRESTNVCIYTVTIDGSSIGTIDGYSASATATSTTITGFTVSTTGRKLLKLAALTKNASSTNYVIDIKSMHFRRTA